MGRYCRLAVVKFSKSHSTVQVSPKVSVAAILAMLPSHSFYKTDSKTFVQYESFTCPKIDKNIDFEL